MELRWDRVEDWLLVLIAMHSVTVGLILLLLTRWVVEFGGWEGLNLTLFPRQAGAFHIIVAVGYLQEYFRHREVTFLLVTKLIAVFFLVTMMLVEPVPWALPLAALGDGLMVPLIYLVHRRGQLARARMTVRASA